MDYSITIWTWLGGGDSVMIYHKGLVMDHMLQAHSLEEITTELNYFEGLTTFLVGKFQKGDIQRCVPWGKYL